VRKHGVHEDDIHHAVTNAMTVDDQDLDTRLSLGPPRRGCLRSSP
jgi:hypothetical protein